VGRRARGGDLVEAVEKEIQCAFDQRNVRLRCGCRRRVGNLGTVHCEARCAAEYGCRGTGEGGDVEGVRIRSDTTTQPSFDGGRLALVKLEQEPAGR